MWARCGLRLSCQEQKQKRSVSQGSVVKKEEAVSSEEEEEESAEEKEEKEDPAKKQKSDADGKPKPPKRKKTFDIDVAVTRAERNFGDKWTKLRRSMDELVASMSASISSGAATSFRTEKELVCLRLSWLEAVLLQSPKQLDTLKALCTAFGQRVSQGMSLLCAMCGCKIALVACQTTLSLADEKSRSFWRGIGCHI